MKPLHVEQKERLKLIEEASEALMDMTQGIEWRVADFIHMVAKGDLGGEFARRTWEEDFK